MTLVAEYMVIEVAACDRGLGALICNGLLFSAVAVAKLALAMGAVAECLSIQVAGSDCGGTRMCGEVSAFEQMAERIGVSERITQNRI